MRTRQYFYKIVAVSLINYYMLFSKITARNNILEDFFNFFVYKFITYIKYFDMY